MTSNKINDNDNDLLTASSYYSDPTPHQNENQPDEDEPLQKAGVTDTPTSRQISGAAAAGGIAGLIIGGPIFAVVAGIGIAACATTKSKAGEVTRATGDAVSSAGNRVKQWDEKHHVLQKTGDGIIKGCQWVDRQFKGKPKGGSASSQNTTV
jgi:hypothetical protein